MTNQPPDVKDLYRCRRWVDHDLPRLVQEWIDSQGITQGQLATLLDTTRQSLSDRLHGRTRFTAAETLHLLALMQHKEYQWQDTQ